MKHKKVKRAVALTYKAGIHDAPVISAKGNGFIADSIIKEANRSGVPIRRDDSLAEVLSAIDINQQIPSDLYQVVAEILAFVYRIDQKGKKTYEY